MNAPFEILHGDALSLLREMPDESVNCCITSPPYWGLRDYGVDGQIGLERTPEEYVSRLVDVFREVRRVLRDDGTLWLNLGDSYTSGGRKERDPGKSKIHPAFEGENFSDGLRTDTPHGLKPKDLVGIPWRVAFALQADGWWLRQDIIWHKPNPMPESVKDRCTKAHEYVFMLSKSQKYYYDSTAVSEAATCDRMRGPALHGDAISTNGNSGLCRASYRDKQRQVGKRTYSGFNERWNEAEDRGRVHTTRNRRSVWEIPTLPTPEAHFATFPIELPEICLRAGCPEGGVVLDPFAGAGTTGLACLKNGRRFVGIELNQAYIDIAYERARKFYPLLLEAAS